VHGTNKIIPGVILGHSCSKKLSLKTEAVNGRNRLRTAPLSQAITLLLAYSNVFSYGLSIKYH